MIDNLSKLEDKIDEFDERFQEEIKSYRKAINEQLAVIDLKESLGLQRLLNGLKNRIEGIDNRLKDDDKIIGTDEAKFLYHEKLAYKWMLSFFEVAENNLKEIEEVINKNI